MSTTPTLPQNRLLVRWEGLQFANHSMAVVNRELCRELLASGRVELRLIPHESKRTHELADPRMADLAAQLGLPSGRAADVHVWHVFPPSFRPPTGGHWVVMQPWEFGSLPASWIEPMNSRVDEIWVNSTYVRECFIRSGVEPSKVVAIPHGVDPERFHPRAPPIWLPTRKSFKFLFVGGTIPRKGADILLETYLSTFGPDDDVCLVIKDFGTDTIYRGQGLGERIRQLRADPGKPEILYLDAVLPSAMMPGLYTAGDCLVHPYRGEGFCLPIAEAMACGLPVVVPNHGACLDYCDPSVAYLVPAREVRVATTRVGDLETVDHLWWAEIDRPALSAALRRAVERRQRGRELGQRASEKIRSRFTWRRAAELVLERLAIIAARPVVRHQSDRR